MTCCDMCGKEIKSILDQRGICKKKNCVPKMFAETKTIY